MRGSERPSFVMRDNQFPRRIMANARIYLSERRGDYSSSSSPTADLGFLPRIPVTTWVKPAEGGTQKSVLSLQAQRVEGGGGWFCLWRAAPAASVDRDRLISQFRENTKLTEQLEGDWSAFIIECS